MKKTTFLEYMDLLKEDPDQAQTPQQPPAQAKAPGQKFISGSTQILNKYEGLKGLVQQVVDFNADWIEFEKQINLVLVNAGKSSHDMSRQHAGMKRSIQDLTGELQEWKNNFETTKQSYERQLQQANATIDQYQGQLQQAKDADESQSSSLKLLLVEMQHQSQANHEKFVQEQQKAEKLEAKIQRVFAQGQTDTTEADQIMENLNTALAASKSREVELRATMQALKSAYERLLATHAKTPRFEPREAPEAPQVAHTDHEGSVIKERRSKFSEYMRRN